MQVASGKNEWLEPAALSSYLAFSSSYLVLVFTSSKDGRGTYIVLMIAPQPLIHQHVRLPCYESPPDETITFRQNSGTASHARSYVSSNGTGT